MAEQKLLDRRVYSSKYFFKEILSCFTNLQIDIYLIFGVMFSKKTFSFPCTKKQLSVRLTTCCLYIWDWKTLIFLLNLLVLGFLVLRNTGGCPTLSNLIDLTNLTNLILQTTNLAHTCTIILSLRKQNKKNYVSFLDFSRR